MSTDGQATIDRWRKRMEQDQELGEAAQKNMKKYIKAAMEDKDTHNNITKELLATTKTNRSKFRGNESGFNIMEEDEIVTGFEPVPWSDDVD